MHRTFEIASPVDDDAPLQLRIDSCRLDVDACSALCSMMMVRAQVGSEPTACDVEFRPGRVTAVATYTVYHGGSNCPVFDALPPATASAARPSHTSRCQGDVSCRA